MRIILTLQGMALLVPWVTSSLVLLCMSQIVLGIKIVLRGSPKLNHVPQDITTDVKILDLKKNSIQILHNTSFHRLEKVAVIELNFNPIWKIDNGTFDKNILLRVFTCNGCRLRVLPACFGPAMSKMDTLYLGNAIPDTGILVSPYFDGFTKLKLLYINQNRFDDIDSIKCPKSVQYLYFDYNGLSKFPNVSSSRFPILYHLRLANNAITYISDSALASMSSTVRILELHKNKLVEIGDITQLNNLETLTLHQNQLETIPDMLEGAPLIEKFTFKDNTHMACDHRMCWMRLWDRVRAPILTKDDVQCMASPAAKGFFLSLINPALMQCYQGSITEFECQRRMRDYFKSLRNMF